MQLWSVICCCCSSKGEGQDGLEGSERVTVKKPDFPRIVIQARVNCFRLNDFDPLCPCQEPTPLVPRKESEIAGEVGYPSMLLHEILS